MSDPLTFEWINKRLVINRDYVYNNHRLYANDNTVIMIFRTHDKDINKYYYFIQLTYISSDILEYTLKSHKQWDHDLTIYNKIAFRFESMPTEVSDYLDKLMLLNI